MSAPVMESTRIPMELPVADSGAGLNFLAIVRRRWPWVLVGLFIGVVGGLLAYFARPAVYQSNGQILVVKNQQSLPGGNAGVMSYMEDYMATQVTIIKSEKVLTNAARRIPNDLRSPFPTETSDRYRMLTQLFTAAREKDPNAPMAVNNVLNVSMKGANPDDCQKILEVIIDAYRDELRGVYDEATNRKQKLLEKAIETNVKKVAENRQLAMETVTAIQKQTQESPDAIQIRFSKGMEVLRLYENEDVETRSWLAQIDACSKDKKARGQLLMRLAQYMNRQMAIGGGGRADQQSFLYLANELRAQIEEIKKKLGPDHPNMEALLAREKFLREQYAKDNPSDPDGNLDGLSQLESMLRGRLETLTILIGKAKADTNQDMQKLQAVLPLKNKVESLEKFNESREKLIDTYETERLQNELTRATGGYEANLLNTPSREVTPVAPKLNQSLLLGMAAGLLFGVGLAALAELSDKGFRSPADIRARLGLQVIGHIPPIRTNLPAEEPLDIEPTLVVATRPKSVEAEAYRGVRTALYFNAAGSTHQMIQVTSPNQGDGKSTLAANLAVSIAQSGKRVLLVDCDMRRPRVHRVFHINEQGPGLSAVIAGSTPLSNAILRTPVENLWLLPCGKKPANPAELLTSPNFGDLLDRLKSDYDYVILDTPPVLAVSDPSAVAPRADGVILVFRMTSKVRPAAERAREQLAQIGANIIGVVVNGSGRGRDATYGGYAYGYGSDYTGYTHDQSYMDNYAGGDEDEESAPPKKG